MTTLAKQYRIRINEDLKEQSEALFEGIGLSFNSAIQLFLTQSLLNGNLPFEVKSDPLYSEANMRRIAEAIDQLDKGQGKAHELIEDDAE